jgi:hypothetical protein
MRGDISSTGKENLIAFDQSLLMLFAGKKLEESFWEMA